MLMPELGFAEWNPLCRDDKWCWRMSGSIRIRNPAMVNVRRSMRLGRRCRAVGECDRDDSPAALAVAEQCEKHSGA